MTTDPLQAARATVLGVLEGRLTGAWVQDDDVLYLAARSLEKSDPMWLRAQLEDRRYGVAQRMLVFQSLAGAVRAAVESGLRAELPDEPIWTFLDRQRSGTRDD
jgi:hypothetical protein